MTAQRPVSPAENQEAHGLALACDMVFQSEMERIEALRNRQADYRASLPASHQEATAEASALVADLIEEDEGGQVTEAVHLSVALGAMLQNDTNALGHNGNYKDAAVYISGRITEALFHIHGELEHLNNVLRKVNGTG
jgi:hypothetical protein